MPLDNKCRIGPLAGAPPDMCWSSSLRLNRDSSLKITRLQSVTLQVARGRQKSSRHCYDVGSVVSVLADVGSSSQLRSVVSLWFLLMALDVWKEELWFQQYGATCHTAARATIDLLKDTLGDHLISRFGPVNWPPRSCYLTPLDYFLWGYVKSLVYADKPQTLDHLEDNILRVIADIRPQMLEKVIENWTTSEPAVAVLCQKSYLKCNATRLSFE
ncbi:putative transposable element [Trichonephila clavipes]|nr:putative transposable element [Trichonephila clavipes]